MMVRSACLPDAKKLASLVAGLNAPLGERTENAVRSVPARASSDAPVAPSSAPRRASEPVSSGGPSVRPKPTSAAPRREEPLGEALLLSELAGQLRGVSSLERGFASVATWLELRTGAQAVFVADAEGLGMTRAGDDEPYLAAAGEIGSALDKLTTIVPGVNEGAVTFELADAQRLVLIGCMTEFGRISVGLVMNTPLDPVWTTVIRKALQDVALRGRTTR